jgi:hypothetical protein
MNQKVGPVALAIAAIVLLALVVVLYRHFFPPLPPPDIDNPRGMPSYAKMAKEYIKNRKPGDPLPTGMPGQPASAPKAGTGGGH